MLMRVFLIILALPVVGVLWLATIWIPAHWQIRQMQMPTLAGTGQQNQCKYQQRKN